MIFCLSNYFWSIKRWRAHIKCVSAHLDCFITNSTVVAYRAEILKMVSIFKYLWTVHISSISLVMSGFLSLFCVFFSEAQKNIFKEHLLVSSRKKTKLYVQRSTVNKHHRFSSNGWQLYKQSVLLVPIIKFAVLS